MKNKKKFKKELYNILVNGDGLALDQDGKPGPCYDIDCHQCRFFTGIGLCSENRKKWLESEYIEPEIDWTKVPIDTKVLVRDYDTMDWTPRYFAGVDKNGERTAWPGGKTSFTVPNDTRSVWRDMKLYKEE